MKVLILYDSFFGNTEEIAQSISFELQQRHEVAMVKADAATLDRLQNLDLIFVGSPTRGFAPTEVLTAFLRQIPAHSMEGVKAAVFDTRIPLEELRPALLRFAQKAAGYADKKIAALLKPSGAAVLMPTEGFLVGGMEGPLKNGERERAAAWAISAVEAVEKKEG